MAQQQSVSTQYWIFKDSDQNHFSQEVSPTGRAPWFVEPHTSLKPADVVYFWREEDSSYFYGWGIVAAEPDPVDGLF